MTRSGKNLLVFFLSAAAMSASLPGWAVIPAGFSQVSVYASNSAEIGANVTVVSGSVVVNDDTVSPTLAWPSGPRPATGTRAVLSSGRFISGPQISMARHGNRKHQGDEQTKDPAGGSWVYPEGRHHIRNEGLA